MKVSITEQNEIELTEVYNPIVLKTNSGEVMSVCMRDSGFEFTYEGQTFYAQNGKVTAMNEKSE